MPSLVVRLSSDQEKKKEPVDPFKDLKVSLDDQEREIGAKIERMEERILQADARSQKDSNPVTSVFGELARSGAWSSA